MPTLSPTGFVPNVWAMCGMAVVMTVPSRFSMKNAPATRSATATARLELELSCILPDPDYQLLPLPRPAGVLAEALAFIVAYDYDVGKCPNPLTIRLPSPFPNRKA